jgi:hypothetical protein
MNGHAPREPVSPSESRPCRSPANPNRPRPPQVPPPPRPAPAPASTPPPAGPDAGPKLGRGVGLHGCRPGSGAGSPTPGVPATPAAPQTYTPEQVAAVQRQYEAEEYRSTSRTSLISGTGRTRSSSAAAGGARPSRSRGGRGAAHPWGLPAFDFALLDMVERDPGGKLVATGPGPRPTPPPGPAVPGAAPEGPSGSSVATPEGPRGGSSRSSAKQVAERIYKEQFGGHQQQQTAQQILDRQRRPWLYERDAQGRWSPSSTRRPGGTPRSCRPGPVLRPAGPGRPGQGITDPPSRTSGPCGR